MTTCATCGQSLPTISNVALTPAELDALSAWWHTGTVKAAADLLSLAERTIINQLYRARIRNGLHSTADLVPRYLGQLRTMRELVESHNAKRREVA